MIKVGDQIIEYNDIESRLNKLRVLGADANSKNKIKIGNLSVIFEQCTRVIALMSTIEPAIAIDNEYELIKEGIDIYAENIEIKNEHHIVRGNISIQDSSDISLEGKAFRAITLYGSSKGNTNVNIKCGEWAYFEFRMLSNAYLCININNMYEFRVKMEFGKHVTVHMFDGKPYVYSGGISGETSIDTGFMPNSVIDGIHLKEVPRDEYKESYQTDDILILNVTNNHGHEKLLMLDTSID